MGIFIGDCKPENTERKKERKKKTYRNRAKVLHLSSKSSASFSFLN